MGLQWKKCLLKLQRNVGCERPAGLNNLKQLRLGRIQITDAGVAKLQQALPKSKIFK